MAGTEGGPWCLDIYKRQSLWYARLPYPINTSVRVFASVLQGFSIFAARLEFWCAPMRVLACLNTVAFCHFFWCSLASHLLISSMTALIEIPITCFRQVGFCLATSLASLSAISLPFILLRPGIQRTATWLSSASLLNASKHSQTSLEMATHPSKAWRLLCYLSGCEYSCRGHDPYVWISPTRALIHRLAWIAESPWRSAAV